MKQVKVLLVMIMMVCALTWAGPVESAANQVLEKISVVPDVPPKLNMTITADRGAWGVYNNGQEIRFTFSSNRAADVAVISINAQGRLNLLLPNPYDPNNRVSANRTESLPRPGYRYIVDTPGPGTEHVLVVGSEHRRDLINELINQISSGMVQDYLALGNLLRTLANRSAGDWGLASVSYYCNYRPTPPPVTTSKTVVVSVGISQYAHLNNLHSPDADAIAFANLMRNKYGVSDVTLLTNAQATKRAILNALSAAEAKMDAQTTFIFYFSGHGGQVEDDDGDEEDGMDELLCPYDFTMNDKRGSGIVDDDIYILIQRYSRKAKHVIFIFDACFAGGAQKSVLMAGSDLIRPLTKTPMGASVGTPSGRALLDVKTAELPNFVFLASSKGNEVSLDLHNQLGHSLYTYFLLKGLNGAADSNGDGRIDTIQLHNYIEKEIATMSQKYGEYLQTPVIDPRKSVFFGN